MSYADDIPYHKHGDQCPSCGYKKGGKLRLIKTKDDSRVFLGCIRHPDCKYTVSSYYTYENIEFQLEREKEEEEHLRRRKQED